MESLRLYWEESPGRLVKITQDSVWSFCFSRWLWRETGGSVGHSLRKTAQCSCFAPCHPRLAFFTAGTTALRHLVPTYWPQPSFLPHSLARRVSSLSSLTLQLPHRPLSLLTSSFEHWLVPVPWPVAFPQCPSHNANIAISPPRWTPSLTIVGQIPSLSAFSNKLCYVTGT